MDTPVIEVHGLHKTFRGARGGSPVVALDDLNLTVERGSIFGLLGPNGAGKTTLIRILATLLSADAGTARVAGIDVAADPAGVRGAIGLAGQYAAVDEYLTGAENIEMVGRLYGLTATENKKRTREVLERIGLTDAAERYVKTYSGGMRRRLDLAASLVGRPEVLFLDEPTTGVDPANRRHLWELIADLVADGTTVLLTTQYLEEADRLADRVAVIDHGRLIGEGTPAELKDATGGTVIELGVPDPDGARAALGDDRASIVDGRLRVPADDGAASLRDILARLDTAGIDCTEAAMRKPTLDDVFLSLTGTLTTAGTPAKANR